MLNSASRNQGMDPSFVNDAFRPTDLAVAASVANMLGLSSLSILDQKLLELPVRSAGLGIPSIIPSLPGAFLAAHLLMVQFLRRAYAPDYFLTIAIDRAYSVPGSSNYACRLSSALNVFSELYVIANGRPHEPMLDSFHMSLEGLGKIIADKFQQRFSLLLAMVQVPGVVQSLSPYQRVTFKSNRARGVSSVITSLPVRKSTVTDADFVYIVLRRLLRNNLGSLTIS